MKHLCLTALVVLVAASTARADVGVVVTGEATLQPQLAAQLEDWLGRRGHTVAVSPLEPDAINTLVDCFVIGDLNCARAVVEKRTKARAVVYVRVATAAEPDGSRDISIIGYWLQKGHETIGERRNCQRCTEADIRIAADDLMHALASEPPVSSHVPTPTQPLAAMPADTPATQRSRLIPGVVIGSGAALTIAGGVLIAIDQDEADLPLGGAQSANFRDTATAGVICLGVGLAALTVGTVLWFREGESSAPVAAITSDAAVVGWAGRF